VWGGGIERFLGEKKPRKIQNILESPRVQVKFGGPKQLGSKDVSRSFRMVERQKRTRFGETNRSACATKRRCARSCRLAEKRKEDSQGGVKRCRKKMKKNGEKTHR